jgi:8-oxo-(d)GTP phosphatase
VHRPRYDDWSYPKGKREPGEHVLVTAVREVAEETGLRVVLGRPLTPTTYLVSTGIKQVSYWAARCTGSLAAAFSPNDEVDEVAWLPPEKARDRLAYERDVTLLDEFCSGPVATSPLILLRHAEAGPKPDRTGPGWVAADLARPLDARGVAEADLLATLLASYGRCRVISSAAERCAATVRPYAAAVGVPVETESAFTVAPGQSPAEAGARRAAVLAASGEPALICAHRENLPALIDAAFGALGGNPPDPAPLRKGEFWVLQSAGGALISAERHDLASLASWSSSRGSLLAANVRGTRYKSVIGAWGKETHNGRRDGAGGRE